MKKISICLILTLIIIAGMFIYRKEKSLSSEYTVTAVLPERQTLKDYVTLRGSVVEKERYQVFLPFSAKTVKVYVSEGEKISKGDILMTVSKEDDDAVSASALLESIKSAIRETVSESVNSADVLAVTEEKNGVIRVYSPCAGTVMSIASSLGSAIFKGGACAVISDTDRLEIKAEADESVISDIKTGNECTIRVKAVSRDVFEGRVLKIMPYAKTAFSLSGKSEKGTGVIISLPEKNGLKPGYTALVSVVTDIRENALLLPFEAIGQDDENREYVLVLSNGKAEKRYIETGKELSDKCEILSGINGREKVILYPDIIPKECMVVK